MRNILVHLRSLFEHATEGIVVIIGQGAIIMINPSASQMFVYTSEELEGQPIEVLIPPWLKDIHVKHRNAFYRKPENRKMGYNRDLQGGKKDGTTFPVEVSLSTYVQDEERYVIAFVIDITRRKEIEENIELQKEQLEKVTDEMRILNIDLEIKVEERTTILKEALQRLEQYQIELNQALNKERQLNEIKSRFVSMASHEFRTPLSTVLSSASLIDKYTSLADQDKRARHIEKIKNSVKYLNDLLEDFLSLGKLDEGKICVHLHKFSLEELIRDTIEEMSPALKAGHKIISYSRLPHLIVSDKNLIRNILFNLISNAIKFTEDSGAIRISSEMRDNKIFKTLRDEGTGISEEDQEHFFFFFSEAEMPRIFKARYWAFTL